MTSETLQAPDPETGWARDHVVVENAVVTPPLAYGPRPVCGVFGPGGDEITAAHWKENRKVSQPLQSRPEPRERLSGTHVYGGFLFAHFGHFIVESLSRLWLSEAAGGSRVLMVPRRDGIRRIGGFQRTFFDLLSPRPVDLVLHAVEVERLIIPGQGFGLGKISRATPEFRHMLRERLAHLPADGPNRIYISRTGLPGAGSVLNEDALERNLQRRGYAVMHPQTMGIEEQLSWFKSATHVVGVDSSAFHLLGFVARPDQRVAIILRRNVRDFVPIAAQLEGMIGAAPDIVNALMADWTPPHKTVGNHQSQGEVDHAVLSQRLMAAGFVDDTQGWEVPDRSAVDAAVAHAEQASGHSLTRRVIDRRIER